MLEPVDPHSVGYDAHVLNVYENLDEADAACSIANRAYQDTHNDRLYAEVQASTFHSDV